MALSVSIKKRLRTFTLDVNVQVERPSEVLGLLGASGCGKSMTLKCIAGIERPDSGRIVLGDRVLFDSAQRIDLPPQERRVGYLFQNYALFPNMTVLQNVMCGVRGGGKAERRSCAERQIAAMRLQGLEGARPAELSGGQQQRCAMARILANDPEVILLDEPFSALDGYLRWQLELELSDTLRSFPGGTVFVSHNRDEVYRMCDTVCVLSDGRSEPKLPMREFFARPLTLAAALISGCKNVSRATVVGDGMLRCEDWGVTLATGIPVPADVTDVGIRAHYFRPACQGDCNRIPCTVDRVIDSTFSTIVMLRTPAGGLLRYELEKDDWARLGNPSRLALTIDPACVMPLTGGERGAR